MKTFIRPKNSDAQLLALGAKNAEIATAKKQIADLRAKVADLKNRIAKSNKTLAARFAKFGIEISDDPTREEIEAALVVGEGYAVKAKQLAEAQACALGFQRITDEELDACVGR
jgi:ribose 5-phosphate isomerase RpiB